MVFDQGTVMRKVGCESARFLFLLHFKNVGCEPQYV